MSQHLSSMQAFEAMRLFLIQFNAREKSESIDLLLSWTALADDGSTSDPAQWHDWIQSVESVLGADPGSE